MQILSNILNILMKFSKDSNRTTLRNAFQAIAANKKESIKRYILMQRICLWNTIVVPISKKFIGVGIKSLNLLLNN